MTREYPHIAARLIDEPLLAHPDKAQAVARVVLDCGSVEVNVAQVTQTAPQAGPLQERRMASRRDGQPFLFDPNTGVAVIEVLGSLAHRQGHIGASSGVMGYDGIRTQIDAAMADPSVRGVIFDIHSFGGEVAGAFQLADRMASFRGQKPMQAIADEVAFSAAYLIAAACDEIWLASDTAQVGSVGMVMVHVSYQGALEADGIKATIIHAGDQKADGNPFEDMTADQQERFQSKINAVYDEFVTRVAAWRGIADSRVRRTEVGIFMGEDAIAVGLANGIADPSRVFNALAGKVSSQPLLRAI